MLSVAACSPNNSPQHNPHRQHTRRGCGVAETGTPRRNGQPNTAHPGLCQYPCCQLFCLSLDAAGRHPRGWQRQLVAHHTRTLQPNKATAAAGGPAQHSISGRPATPTHVPSHVCPVGLCMQLHPLFVVCGRYVDGNRHAGRSPPPLSTARVLALCRSPCPARCAESASAALHALT